MSRLSDLIRSASKYDPQLGADLQAEVKELLKRQTFGLVFERHQPEAVELPGRRVKRGDKVRILSLREADGDNDHRIWVVQCLDQSTGTAHLLEKAPEAPESTTAAVEDLVVVAEFRDKIYPGLVESARIENGGDAPFHTVINAENHHALELLTYTHAEGIDLIYIDPPYNTGGKFAWLYNDNYVDRNDDFAHSKWLAFMERRLLLAHELLKPTGAIMVSIGDDEQHRLRMLMDQIFGSDNKVAQLAVEMSTTSGPKTTNAQQGTIVKNTEYVLIYRKSSAFDTSVQHTPLYDSVPGWDSHYSLWLNDDGTIGSLVDKLESNRAVKNEIERLGLVHESGKRKGRFLGMSGMDDLLATSAVARKFIRDNMQHIATMDKPPVSAANVQVEAGYWVELAVDHRTYWITRTSTGTLRQLYTLDRNFRHSDDFVPTFGRTVIRGDLWRGFHQDMGNVSKEGGIAFQNGKKPIRLISQLIKWANNSPDAVILDFFGGSGSTTHAVAAMNHADGGHRQSILVTNNEVSRDSYSALAKAGYRPGDQEWEAEGVFESRTLPRLRNAARTLPMNLAAFRLTFEQPRQVRHHRTFGRIAPMLWLRAGMRGRVITDLKGRGWDVAEAYGVLHNLDQSTPFIDAVAAAQELAMAFIITDDDAAFQLVCRSLPDRVRPVRLYESYLQNFAINRGAR